jgi:hypothetical protein
MIVTPDNQPSRRNGFDAALTLVVLALSLALLLQGWRRWDGGRRSTKPAREVSVDEVLPNVFLTRLTGVGLNHTQRLHSIPQRGCVVVVAFASACPGSAGAAPRWRGVRSIQRQGLSLPVIWLAVDATDSSNTEFVRTHELGMESFAVRSDRDRWNLGIAAWPSIMIIGPGGHLLSRPGIFPDDITAIPSGCSTNGLVAGGDSIQS